MSWTNDNKPSGASQTYDPENSAQLTWGQALSRTWGTALGYTWGLGGVNMNFDDKPQIPLGVGYASIGSTFIINDTNAYTYDEKPS